MPGRNKKVNEITSRGTKGDVTSLDKDQRLSVARTRLSAGGAKKKSETQSAEQNRSGAMGKAAAKAELYRSANKGVAELKKKKKADSSPLAKLGQREIDSPTTFREDVSSPIMKHCGGK